MHMQKKLQIDNDQFYIWIPFPVKKKNPSYVLHKLTQVRQPYGFDTDRQLQLCREEYTQLQYKYAGASLGGDRKGSFTLKAPYLVLVKFKQNLKKEKLLDKFAKKPRKLKFKNLVCMILCEQNNI